MKITQLFFGLIFCFLGQLDATGQTVAIYNYLDDSPDPEDVSGTVVNAPFGSSIRRFYIDNTIGGSFEFRILRVKIEEAAGAQDYLAFGQNEGIADVYLPEEVSPEDSFLTPDSHTLFDLTHGFLASYYIYNGSNGCSQYRYYILNAFDTKIDSIDVRFCSNVGIEDYENANITIYPNPSSDFLNVDFKNEVLSTYYALIYDMEGREVLRRELIGQSFDISTLKSGHYVLKLIDSANQSELLNTSLIIN